MKAFSIIAALLLAGSALAQPLSFNRGDSIKVYNNSVQYSWPWAGGHNFCQISDIDLDQDGVLDLFIFDRTGNRITTFLNKGTANTVDYEYAPEYERMFPPLHDWVLLRDYNCDGKNDIFSYSISGFGVWKNISTSSSGLQFVQVSSLVYSDYNPSGNPQYINLYVSPVDLPAIRDIDDDGDLDVATYSILGQFVEYHKNMSMETFGTCDSIRFELASNCWGEYSESGASAAVTLNQSCPPPIMLNPDETAARLALIRQFEEPSNVLHAGSCIECFDTDNDGDVEAIVGDISYDHLTMLRNGGTASFAHMDSVDVQYPSYDVPAAMNIFLCGYHIDVNNDGKNDFLTSPNAGSASENYHSIWLYNNTGQTDSTILDFVQNNFIQDNEIEVGEGAYPVLFDYNNDGKLDLFIANYGYYNSGVYDSKITLYRNSGTSTLPQFTFQNGDFANIFSGNLGLINFPPTFGDLDNDGDKDMIVGAYDGKLHYFQNNSGNYVLNGPNYQGIDVGNFSTPQLIDLDRDGKLDLVIGEQSGNVNYYRNTGTVFSPSFSLTAAALGNIDVRQTNFITGYSTPFVFDVNGSYKMLVGSEQGWIHYYDNIDNNLSGSFTEVDSMYQDIWAGTRTFVTGGDLNADGLLDLVIGNYSGGVALYLGDNNNAVSENTAAENNFTLYPNPAQDAVTIQLNRQVSSPLTIRFYDMSGRLMKQEKFAGQQTTIGISDLPAGVYHLTVQSGNTISHRKLVVGR